MAREDGIPGWTIEPAPSFTTCTAIQRWLFDGDNPRAVLAGETELPLDDPRIRHLGPLREAATGTPYPGSFSYSPRTGALLDRPAVAVPEDFGRPFASGRGAPSADLRSRSLRFAIEGASAFSLNAGRASLFAAGVPSNLYAFHDNLGSFEWRDESSGEWHPVGRLTLDDALGRAGDLPHHAQALVTRLDGVAFATPNALVFVPLPQIGDAIAAVVVSSPGLDVLGAPVLDMGSIVAPASRDGQLVVARSALGLMPPAGHIAPDLLAVAGALEVEAHPGFFAPATLDRAGVASWCGPTGALVFDRQVGTARFEPWRPGFTPILAQRPYRDRQDIFHQLGLFEGSYHYAQIGGAALRSVPGPHLAVGSRTFWATETAESIDGQDRENLTLPPGESRSLVLPLIGLGFDTLVALVRMDGSVRGFIGGETLPSGTTARLFHHQRLNGLHDLRQTLELRSFFDVAAFVRAGHVHVHSRMENRCLVLPVSS